MPCMCLLSRLIPFLVALGLALYSPGHATSYAQNAIAMEKPSSDTALRHKFQRR